MLYQEIEKTGRKTIYETDISDFIRSYRANWKRATPAARKAAKEHWTNIYRNSIFPESFRNAEKMLAIIADLEAENIGVDPDEVKMYIFDGWTKTAKYKEV